MKAIELYATDLFLRMKAAFNESKHAGLLKDCREIWAPINWPLLTDAERLAFYQLENQVMQQPWQIWVPMMTPMYNNDGSGLGQVMTLLAYEANCSADVMEARQHQKKSEKTAAAQPTKSTDGIAETVGNLCSEGVKVGQILDPDESMLQEVLAYEADLTEVRQHQKKSEGSAAAQPSKSTESIAETFGNLRSEGVEVGQIMDQDESMLQEGTVMSEDHVVTFVGKNPVPPAVITKLCKEGKTVRINQTTIQPATTISEDVQMGQTVDEKEPTLHEEILDETLEEHSMSPNVTTVEFEARDDTIDSMDDSIVSQQLSTVVDIEEFKNEEEPVQGVEVPTAKIDANERRR